MKIDSIKVGSYAANCYIVSENGRDCAVIDPGDEPDKIIAKLKTLGLAPAMILLTHGHPDHIGGVKALMEAYPGAKLYYGAGEEEVIRWSGQSHPGDVSSDLPEYIITNGTALSDGAEVSSAGLTFQVMATPGHSRGCVVYIAGQDMFSGDTLFFEDIGRCDLFTSDYPEMLRTMKKLRELPGDYSVYPGHEQATTMDHEREFNPYLNGQHG